MNGPVPPYSLPVDEVVTASASDPERGLRNDQVAALGERHGFNELAEAPPIPLWRKFLSQFGDLVIWILIVAAVISGLLGEWPDAAAILAIVLLNGLLGFFQEASAEQALAALRKLSAPLAKVIRNGVLEPRPARELVPGDLIELEAGDNIPAEARLLRAFGFRVQEAALTGESVPVEKDAAAVLGAATPLGDRRNMAYMGTVAAAGKAKAIVVATGMNTELGRIAGLLQRHEPESTPLQRRLAELGRVLIVACLVVVGLIFSLQMLRGGGLVEVFLLSVSLAVAAVPEGLPAVVTMALALGLQRMVKRNALIRKLPSVETLGSVTVICSDKTGTLTRNEMTVREVVASGERYLVTGVGYSPRGEFLRASSHASMEEPPADANDARRPTIEPRAHPDLLRALTIGLRCNHATVNPQGNGSDVWQVVGDPTEGALVVAALKAGLDADSPDERVIHEMPFDSERKAMSVVVRERRGSLLMYTKGAPEVILGKCTAERRAGEVVTLTEDRRSQIVRQSAEMASRALRVLGLAYREPLAEGPMGYEERDLIFAGLVGMIDPPRDEAKEAVQKCHEAGIRPVMITGDHPATALAIARELRIAASKDQAVTGQELDAMSDNQLAERVEQIPVYARVSAEHKLRVVRAWKRNGQVVAMTGDGVNDAPAVKAADIGIAMGVTGTDVTKEASAMVLTDDNFASIVNAVEEGRCIFDNIQKFLHYLLAGNIGLILFVIVAVLTGWPFPLTTIQILWINLVTNGLPALALGMEPPERDLMRRPPRPPREPVIGVRRALLLLVHGALLATVTAIGFAVTYQGEPANLPRARTVTFCVVSYAFVLFSFSCRSQRYTLPELGLFTNPPLLGAVGVSVLLQLSVVTLPFARPFFESAQHFAWEWAVVFGLASVPVTVSEVLKIIDRRTRRAK
jgi:Ca2+-transporting ATPase